MPAIIKNEHLSVTIDSRGAELRSVQSLTEGLEYLWQGSGVSWNRRAPLLFPLVGGLNENRYIWKGETFRLAMHGFARDQIFGICKESANEVVFSLRDSEESLKVFPFSFHLKTGYKLEGHRLAVSYSVSNENDEIMPFSIGGHPGFNCPLEKGLSFSDYRLVFDREENCDRRIKAGTLLSGVREPFFKGGRELALDHGLFDRGALIFDDLSSESICLVSDKGDRRIKMDFAGFPYFGIWTWPESRENFICLEPWYGIDSTRGDSAQWIDKEGLLKLDPGEVFEASYSMEFF